MNERFPIFTMRISRLYRLIQKLKTDGMGRFGLKAVDTLCLYQLSTQDTLTFSQVAEHCDLDPALVSRTLRSLVKEGMVQKEGDPGKYHARYSLTEEGRVRTAQITAIIRSIQSQADEGIDAQELNTFYRVLGQLTANFEAMANGPSQIFSDEPTP